MAEATSGSAAGLVVQICGFAALRPAEARALIWADIDIANSVISITKQLDKAGQPTKAKTKTAYRRIQVPTNVSEALEAWKPIQTTQRILVGPAWNDSGLVVTSELGTALDRNNVNRAIRTVCPELGLTSISAYDLRHTAITHLTNRGYSNWDVADFAGTSNRMIDDVYRKRTERVIRLTGSPLPVTDLVRNLVPESTT